MRFKETDYYEDKFVLQAHRPRKKGLFKTKPETSSEQARRPKIIDSVSVVEGTSRRSYPNLNELRDKSPARLSSLITQFVLHRGPSAVFLRIMQDSADNKEWKQFGSREFSSDEIKSASGLVFERLAYYDFKEIHAESSGFFLDPGSCSRIFNKLNDLGVADFTPDGLQLTMNSNIPTIVRLLEYKSNPGVRLFGDQIERMNRFLSEYSGKVIGFPELAIDYVTGLKSSRLAVAPNASITLVVPNNRFPSANYVVHVEPTSFSSGFLGAVTHATLRDLV